LLLSLKLTPTAATATTTTTTLLFNSWMKIPLHAGRTLKVREGDGRVSLMEVREISVGHLLTYFATRGRIRKRNQYVIIGLKWLKSGYKVCFRAVFLKLFFVCFFACVIITLSGPAADHSPPSRAKVRNEWRYTSTPLRLHGVVLS
jgi:hypothetical protein